MKNEEIREEKERLFKKILTAEAKLDQLRHNCNHTSTSQGLYAWRIGAARPAIICDSCGELIYYL